MFSLLDSQLELSWPGTLWKDFCPHIQIPSWCKALLPAPAVFKISLATPSSSTSRLQCCVVQHERPQNTQISRKKLEEEEISNLFAGDEIFPYSALTSLQSFPLFYFFSWKASPFLPELSVPRQLSQPRIWAAQRMAVLKSLSFVFHVFLSLGSPTLQPAVTSSSGHSANPALPREVCGGISCCSGNSSYSSNSLPLLGAPVFGSCCCILGDFHSITFYKWSGCTKDLFKIKKLSLNSGSGWIREYVM